MEEKLTVRERERNQSHRETGPTAQVSSEKGRSTPYSETMAADEWISKDFLKHQG